MYLPSSGYIGCFVSCYPKTGDAVNEKKGGKQAKDKTLCPDFGCICDMVVETKQQFHGVTWSSLGF